MKVSIEYENKEYILEFSRKTASELSNALAKSNAEPDIFLQGELMIKYSMKKNHGDISAEETAQIVSFILDNYSMIDSSETNEKGMLTTLNDMLMEAIPKGFTNTTTLKKFKVE